jgi:hypothetical protein
LGAREGAAAEGSDRWWWRRARGRGRRPQAGAEDSGAAPRHARIRVRGGAMDDGGGCAGAGDGEASRVTWRGVFAKNVDDGFE